MIVDWNRHQVKKGQVFHFKNSLIPFIEISTEDDFLFLDIDEWKAYTFDEIQSLYWPNFYRKEDDEDFLGVEIDGKAVWVDDSY